MAKGRLIIAPLSDGTYVAASTVSPFFCTTGADSDEVCQRAKEAATFFNRVTSSALLARSRVTQVENVIPHKVDPWVAKSTMRVS
jgi:predicted RNase H-like HicB family nuclease